MASRIISQREARRLKQRVDHLESLIRGQRNSYMAKWKGVEIHREDMTVIGASAFQTARKLGHAVVVAEMDGTVARFVALPHIKEEA